MQQLSLSWTIGIGLSAKGGLQKQPQWEDVESRLQEVRDHSGAVTLYLVDPPEIGPQGLQVFCDRGNFLLMLSELTADDHEVRGYWNPDAEPGQTEILGDMWDTRMLCQDFEIVKNALMEFFNSGDVEHSLLS
jgi:hypothetical protein